MDTRPVLLYTESMTQTLTLTLTDAEALDLRMVLLAASEGSTVGDFFFDSEKAVAAKAYTDLLAQRYAR